MRAIWNGSVSFGLVNIPVRLYSGLDSREELELHMLHKKDLSPIRYARVCTKDGKEIPYDEIVKGYEYGEGDYIVLTEEDYARADARRTRTIDIEGFVEEGAIDVRYYEKPYYLEPQKGAAHAYALLREALEQSGKVGIGRFVMRNRENLAVLKPVGRVIALTQIRFPAELRAPGQLELPEAGQAKGRELEMALSLIGQLSRPFEPDAYHDTYTEALKEVIAERAKGRKPKAKGEAPAATRVQDLMEALRASLEKAGRKPAASGKASHAPDRVRPKTPVR